MNKEKLLENAKIIVGREMYGNVVNCEGIDCNNCPAATLHNGISCSVYHSDKSKDFFINYIKENEQRSKK